MKQLTISAAFLRIFFLACIISVGIFAYDYYQLKISSFKASDNEVVLSSQSDEILRQRQQIHEFAEEIAGLKTKLIELNDFEKKIRIIANIETSTDQDSLFGVGGSMPEDLDTDIPLTEKHNSLMREMHEQVDQLHIASANQGQGFEYLLKTLKDQQTLLACTPAIRPSQGWITSRFGYRISPFTGRREFHKGYDIANRKDTKITATADGIVTYAGPKGLLGNVVVIDHGHGMVTRYGHLNKSIVKRGDAVKRGQKIALMGNTGRSTGPHVHYEVHLNGIPVNPEKYILN